MSLNRNVTVPLGNSAITRNYTDAPRQVKSAADRGHPQNLGHATKAGQPGMNHSRD